MGASSENLGKDHAFYDGYPGEAAPILSWMEKEILTIY